MGRILSTSLYHRGNREMVEEELVSLGKEEWVGGLRLRASSRVWVGFFVGWWWYPEI